MSTQVSRVESHRGAVVPQCPHHMAGNFFFELPSGILSCSPELRPVLAKIQAFFPEVLRVMQATIGNPIAISLVQENFSARWDFGSKEISIGQEHFNQDRSFGPITDLLFEMQNACYTNLFIRTQREAHKFTVEGYVRKVEEIEWSTAKLTSARLESLPEEDFPSEANDFLNTYLEDFELFYLHQQTSGHAFVIADRYRGISGVKDLTPYKGTWKRPFNRGDRSGKILYELLILHLKIFRTGKGAEELRENIRIIESYALDAKWAEDVLVNLRWFSEKFEASPHFSNSKVPLYKPDGDKLKLLGIFD